MSFTIIGTGSELPKKVVSNDDLSEFLDTNDEWISDRTGIKTRHICVEETLSDLAEAAGAKALSDAGVKAEELDYILCATVRGDYFTPSLACVIQKRLGATCPAMDINAACSGFLYTLDVAAGYFARGKAKKILVIAAEAGSKIVDWTDRSVCVLFGDGAGAAVLSEGDDLLGIQLTAKGNDDVMRMPNIEGNCPYNPKEEPGHYLYMNGREIYKFAVGAICTNVREALSEADLAEEKIDYVLPHQANVRIIDGAQKRLGIAKEKFLMEIENMGNISSASIPILLDRANRRGDLKKGNLLLLIAFGGGLTTGAAIIRWNR